MDTDITIVLTGDDLADHLWQSDEYDLTPEDLTIQFNRGYIAQAREIFKHYPDLSNISFNAFLPFLTCCLTRTPARKALPFPRISP